MSDSINLLVLTHNYPRFEGDFAGGFVALLARRLALFDIQPVILAPHAPGSLEYEEVEGVRVYRFRYAKDDKNENMAYRGDMHKLVLGSVGGAFRFKRFLDCFRRAAFEIIGKERIDVVSGHWLVPAGMVMKTIAQKTDLPMVLSSHGTDIRLVQKYSKMAYRYLRTFCSELKTWTVVSNYLRDGINSLDPRLSAIVEVLPVPHDETVFFRDDRIREDGNLVVGVTRFTRQKRVDYLIKAFALVVEQKPEARLELYGSGPLQSQMERLMDKFGLQEQAAIFPPVPQAELREVYNRAAIVVLNSFQEGFGLALSEAMLCGAAVIGTNSGGITDIIKDGERGLLVEPDNSRELATAMLRLLNDQSLRKDIADNGHRFACRTYASTPLAGRYAQIVRNALKR